MGLSATLRSPSDRHPPSGQSTLTAAAFGLSAASLRTISSQARFYDRVVREPQICAK